jgi:hypothetical protein
MMLQQFYEVNCQILEYLKDQKGAAKEEPHGQEVDERGFRDMHENIISKLENYESILQSSAGFEKNFYHRRSNMKCESSESLETIRRDLFNQKIQNIITKNQIVKTTPTDRKAQPRAPGKKMVKAQKKFIQFESTKRDPNLLQAKSEVQHKKLENYRLELQRNVSDTQSPTSNTSLDDKPRNLSDRVDRPAPAVWLNSRRPPVGSRVSPKASTIITDLTNSNFLKKNPSNVINTISSAKLSRNNSFKTANNTSGILNTWFINNKQMNH